MATDHTAEAARKIGEAKQKKDAGDQAFKVGNMREALLWYHQALLYLVGLDKSSYDGLKGLPSAEPDSMQVQQKSETDETISKIYANMSACHIKQGNWNRAIETADKALAKNSKNYKAMFRKGKALGEWGYFEKAEKILEQLKAESASGCESLMLDSAAVDVELSRLRALDYERDQVNRRKMKGFLKKQDLAPQE
ncbi:hypothetical protein AX15_004131 [Amanita polypyramis BW_CC]|nr:hypothetical protein AX15_004131 [Amanita polypyramis BW_CC]